MNRRSRVRVEDTGVAQIPVGASALALVALGLLAYSNSFRGEFVFDDIPNIVENPTIRGSVWSAFQTPQGGHTAQGRPLVNLSLAFNYALGGLDVRGYHAFNLVVHLLAGLMLLGGVRRTLNLLQAQGRYRGAATELALAAALIWTLHPLQTESVSYIVQRAESMMGLCYLLTLYCAIRGATERAATKWNIAAIVACAAGMACKEVMVSAPLMVALYDRVFVYPSWAAAVKERKWLYLGQAATWILLLVLVIPAATRGGSAGIGQGVSSWEYLLTQAGAITRYLRLVFWPQPLVQDYGMHLARHPSEIVPYGLFVVALLMGTLAAWKYQPWAGFLGTWFFAVLAPSSSVVPIVTQTIAEHRMYLALAPLVILLLVIAETGWMRLAHRSRKGQHTSEAPSRWAPRLVVAVIVIACAARTYDRNFDYQTQAALTHANLRDWPGNPRLRLSMATQLMSQGETAQALLLYDQAIEQDPEYAPAYDARGSARQKLGQYEAAVHDHTRAIELKPDAMTYNNRGVAYRHLGKLEQALADHTRAIELNPRAAHAYYNRGVVARQIGRNDLAVADFSQAIALEPGMAAAYHDRATVYQTAGQLTAALADYSKAIELAPQNALPWLNRGALHEQLGQIDAAIGDYSRALAIDPNDGQTYLHRARCLQALGRGELARADLAQAESLGVRPAENKQ
jgi:tetratricopeptide (TPR) repeat protein